MTATVVTGASTPIGEAVIERLLGADAARRVIAVLAPHEPIPRRAAGGERVTWEHADLTRARDIHRLLFGAARRLEADTLVHLALHRSALDEGDRVRALNVSAARELLDAVERHPTIRRFVLRSHAEVYRARAELPAVVDERHPLEFDPRAPQWIRDRVETDLEVCSRMGLTSTVLVVLRCAECLARGTGSQLYDWLGSRVCLTPLGFDPMLDLASVADLAQALTSASSLGRHGVLNVPGADRLPLSALVREAGRAWVPLPGPALGPLYALRTLALGSHFRYRQNRWRFHHGVVLDGRRAREALGYVPSHPLDFAALRRELAAG
ncbi:MAG: NAD-dependent epimerase/dehydratase family protein [Polyangiaceae bacterium]|nr:NAD-dependent epimerase/dehydratase family protein [Polyangiaceae bacterium]